ncbi:MAG: methyltransferase [Bacteroidota bacterium]
MRAFYRYCWLPFYRLWALRFIRQTRVYRHEGLELHIPPGVFHPGVFFSTPIFIQFLKKQSFQGKMVLDMGAGSGLLGLFAAHKGAKVLAVDLNPLAVQTTKGNAARNGLSSALTVLQSNLFDEIPAQTFDLILINPPYYPKNAANETEMAFFAGEHLEYFETLFQQMPHFIHPNTKIWMILSEDCAYNNIQHFAAKHGFSLTVVFERKKWGERLFVAQVNKYDRP